MLSSALCWDSSGVSRRPAALTDHRALHVSLCLFQFSNIMAKVDPLYGRDKSPVARGASIVEMSGILCGIYGRRNSVLGGTLPEPFIRKDDHFPMGVEVACFSSEEGEVRLWIQEGYDPNTGCSFGGRSVKRTV